MPLVDGISRKQLELLAIQTIVGAKTVAYDRVYSPRPWPARADLFPMVIIQAPHDRKVALGRGINQFNTMIRLVVIGRVVGSSQEQVQSDLDLLLGQIEEALLCTNSFSNSIQQFSTIETQAAVNADGRDFVGEGGLAIECEVYQVFEPVGVPLVGVDMTITNGPGGAQLAQAKVSFPLSA
jgi:hypothetical protein